MPRRERLRRHHRAHRPRSLGTPARSRSPSAPCAGWPASPGVEVVLLSGRTAVDLAERVRVGGARYLGNHGLEHGQLPRHTRAESLRVVADPSHDGHLAASRALAEAVPREIGRAMAHRRAEVPGRHLLVPHGPRHPRGRAARAADRRSPRPGRAASSASPGKRYLELRPPGATEKRDAVAWLLRDRRPATVILIGDDVSDALAFAVLREAREAGSVRGLAVGVHALARRPAAGPRGGRRHPRLAARDGALPGRASTGRCAPLTRRHEPAVIGDQLPMAPRGRAAGPGPRPAVVGSRMPGRMPRTSVPMAATTRPRRMGQDSESGLASAGASRMYM